MSAVAAPGNRDDILKQLDASKVTAFHWKIMFVSSMGFFTEFGPNTTTFIYPSETFPTRVRTTAHGLATAVSRIGGFIGVFFFPYLVKYHTLASAELVAGATALAGIAFTLMLPEPKGKSLEELAKEAEEAPAAMQGAGARSASPA